MAPFGPFLRGLANLTRQHFSQPCCWTAGKRVPKALVKNHISAVLMSRL